MRVPMISAGEAMGGLAGHAWAGAEDAARGRLGGEVARGEAAPRRRDEELVEARAAEDAARHPARRKLDHGVESPAARVAAHGAPAPERDPNGRP